MELLIARLTYAPSCPKGTGTVARTVVPARRPVLLEMLAEGGLIKLAARRADLFEHAG
jgi:hypothetical protein